MVMLMVGGLAYCGTPVGRMMRLSSGVRSNYGLFGACDVADNQR